MFVKKVICNILALCLCLAFANANNAIYSVASIPDSLKKNASAVIRNESVVLTVESPAKANMRSSKTITILNKSADEKANFIEYYNEKLTKISAIKIEIFDTNGKRLKKVKQSDIIDNIAFDGYSLYSDNRVKFYQPKINTYPYTITIEYNTEFIGLLGFPSWMPQTDNTVSVEKSDYTFKIKNGLNFRYKAYNFTDNVEKDDINGYTHYYWQKKGLKAFENEAYMPQYTSFLPYVVFAPTNFEIQNTRGYMTSWENYGKWVFSLNNEENKLSEKTKLEINALVQGIDSEFEKAKKIYKYLQDNTRYVNISIGIGGWKPFDASVTDKVKYGDCKALSNYMMALLKEVGITSYYTTIYSSSRPHNIDYTFPKNTFNHIILTVPLKNDTIFLECTSQHCPFGYITKANEGRNALMITPEGGKLIKTKSFRTNENTQTTIAKVEIGNELDVNAAISVLYKGIQYENIYGPLHQNSEEQKKWLYKNISIANFDINSFLFKPDNQPNPEANLLLNIVINQYVTPAGKKFFLPLNLMNKWTYAPSDSKPRQFAINVHKSFTDIDSIIYTIPANFEAESLPANVTLNTPFGTYYAVAQLNGNSLTYIRKVEFFPGEYPASEFSNFASFMKQVAKADGAKVVLVKK